VLIYCTHKIQHNMNEQIYYSAIFLPVNNNNKNLLFSPYDKVHCVNDCEWWIQKMWKKFTAPFNFPYTVSKTSYRLPHHWKVEALRVLKGWGSHIFRHSAHRWRYGCQPYDAGRFLPPERFLVLISVRGWIDPRAIVRLDELGKLKKFTSSGTWTVTFWPVAQCLNQLRYRVPLNSQNFPSIMLPTQDMMYPHWCLDSQ
jgi:hypothetical protein